MNEPIEQLPDPVPPPPGNSPSPDTMFAVDEWVRIWKDLLTSPDEATYLHLLENRQVNLAYLWLFLAGAIGILFNALFGMLFGTSLTEALGAGVLTLICLAPLSGIFLALWTALGTAIIHWVAKLFGGDGQFDDLMYLYGSINAVVGLIASAIGVIPILGGLVGSLVGMYGLFLKILATKTVHKFDWLKAALVVLLPGLVLVLGIICCVVLVLVVFGFGLEQLAGL